MTAYKVLVTAPRAVQAIGQYRAVLEPAGCVVAAHPSAERLTEEELLPLVSDTDALVCGDDRVSSRVLAAGARLKVIAKWGTGIDSIDLEAARSRGVQVCNTPGAFSEPVADTVLGYLLLFTRQLDRMTTDIREGRWEHVGLRSLSECTLGIIGFGDIGRAVARRAVACGMRILVCDLKPLPPELAAPLRVQMAGLQDLLAQSDFVTLHADLRADNHHLLNAAHLALLKPTAILINTARGGLVDEAALVTALRTGRLAGAALDVFEQEPLPVGSPLREMPNVYLAPHNANASVVAAERVHARTIRNVLVALGLQTS